MRLIDADELLGKAITERRFVVACKDLVRDFVVIRTVYKDLAEFIASAPTINPDDLRPRGRWIPHDDEMFGMTCECSACHIETCGDTPYCPNCGAKMEGEP